MSVFDRGVLAERAMAVERHLRRVADRSDLKLYQATLPFEETCT